MAKMIRKRYLRTSFFFIVGCFCAIVGGGQDHCIVISYLAIAVEVAELVGAYFGFLWLCYAANVLVALVNYINIITSIANV